MNPLLLAVLAALSFGVWTVFHNLGARSIDQVAGAIIVSLSAVIVGALVLLFRTRGIPVSSDGKGIFFLVLAGISAFFIDYLALSAYARGLPLSIGGPIIIGGSMAAAVLIGFFIGEPVSALKLLGILLIIAGGALLATVQT